MSKLIKHDHLVADEWKTLTIAEGETAHSIKLPAGPVLVPTSVWRARRSELIHSEYEHGWLLGVWLAAEEGAEVIERDIDDFSVIAIEFNGFNDGNGLAAARLLRERYGYRGELRAIGVLPSGRSDLYHFGFDAFKFHAHQDIDATRTGSGNFNLPSHPTYNRELQVAMAAG
jgi:uncharacterized protein (DUF934 family)